MKVLKNILKILFIVFFIIIPIGLIFCNMFFDLFGYIVFVDEENQETINEILSREEIDVFHSKIIIVNTEPEDDKVKIIKSDFMIENITLDSESELIKYAEKEGIDTYDTVTKLNYISVIVIFIIIFFKKLLENVELFGKFEEKDN